MVKQGGIDLVNMVLKKIQGENQLKRNNFPVLNIRYLLLRLVGNDGFPEV